MHFLLMRRPSACTTALICRQQDLPTSSLPASCTLCSRAAQQRFPGNFRYLWQHFCKHAARLCQMFSTMRAFYLSASRTLASTADCQDMASRSTEIHSTMFMYPDALQRHSSGKRFILTIALTIYQVPMACSSPTILVSSTLSPASHPAV